MSKNHNLTGADGYYNRFDPAKKYSEHLMLAARGVQASDFNEMQDRMMQRSKSLGDAIFSDGQIIEGCLIDVNPDTGVASLGTGRVYIDGEVVSVPAVTFNIPANEDLTVGVWVTYQVVTEREDATLRDPAVGTENYQQPGSYRLKRNIGWGLNADTVGGGEFYGIYMISGRTVVTPRGVVETNDGVTPAMARYDWDANGHYIVNGLNVRAIASNTAGEQVFTVSEGRAHVEGWEVNIPYSLRLVLDDEPDIETVTNEPHVFVPVNGAMRINTAQFPIEQIREISIKAEKTVNLTHGAFSGAADNLPDTAVALLIQVKQGATTYAEGTDYMLRNNKVDWSPGGNEPSPGSQYSVTYHYYTIGTATSIDRTGFRISGAVPNSDIRVTYDYRATRKDILIIDKNAQVSRVKGVGARDNPLPPTTPTGALRICIIHQDWNGLPRVEMAGIVSLDKADLLSMHGQIRDLYDLVAIERLRWDAQINERTAMLGVFVDPFRTDTMRDQGITQNGAIVGGVLMQPLIPSIFQSLDNLNHTLDYILKPIITQDWRTGNMKINPYMAFEPLPSKFSISPTLDRWNDVVTQWTSDVTNTIVSGWGLATRVTGQSTTSQVVSSQTLELATIRPRVIQFSGEGFGPSEPIKIFFDNIHVASITADSSGKFVGSFSIPSGVPTGTKLVRAVGVNTPEGRASYTAIGFITIEQRRNVTTVWAERYDPLAQTFTLDETRQIAGSDIYFTNRGKTQVRVQIRTTANGIPTQSIVAESVKRFSEINNNAYNRFEFAPVNLEAGIEYALVVLTDDGDAEVGIAQLAKYDGRPGKGWVTQQPYQTGVLLSSSNASTWTPHQDMDLTFVLLAAEFAPTRKTVSLGTVAIAGATDLLCVAEIERTASNTNVVFVLKNESNIEAARFVPGQLLSLTSALESGNYNLSAELSGDTKYSPTLFSGTQLIHAVCENNAEYVSRAFESGANKNIAITVDASLPGGASMDVLVQTAANTYTPALLKKQTNAGDGWTTFRYELASSLSAVRVKIILRGSPADRARARNLKAVSLDV